jgi:hypothetical protein
MFSYKSKQSAKVEEYRSSCPTRKLNSGRRAVFGLPVCFLKRISHGRDGWTMGPLLESQGLRADQIQGIASCHRHVGLCSAMVFSNESLTSLIFTTIFEGYGFGRFGKLQRYQLFTESFFPLHADSRRQSRLAAP